MIFTVSLKLQTTYKYIHSFGTKTVQLTLSNIGKIISKNAVSFVFICLLDTTELMLMEEGDLLGKGGSGLDTAGCCIALLRLLDRGYAPISVARTVL